MNEQLKSFDRNMDEKKKAVREQKDRKDDEEDRLRTLEKELSSLVSKRGQINGEKIVRPIVTPRAMLRPRLTLCLATLPLQSHENAMKLREETAQAVCGQYQFKG